MNAPIAAISLQFGRASALRWPQRSQVLSAWANITGITGALFDAYLTLRGLRTLFPRVERQQKTATTVAAFLQGHSQVSVVHYPGLVSHKGHSIAKAQQSGFGAMLSFDLVSGIEGVRRFVEAEWMIFQLFRGTASIGVELRRLARRLDPRKLRIEIAVSGLRRCNGFAEVRATLRVRGGNVKSHYEQRGQGKCRVRQVVSSRSELQNSRRIPTIARRACA